MTRRSMIAVIVLTGAVVGCKHRADPGTTGPRPVSTSDQTATATVEKIVFIDMKDACDCTAKRTAKSWAELEKATQGIEIPVTRIHMDEQEQEAAVYSDKKPYVTIPAVYFLDADGNLTGMLQGEITQSQFESMISGSSSES